MQKPQYYRSLNNEENSIMHKSGQRYLLSTMLLPTIQGPASSRDLYRRSKACEPCAPPNPARFFGRDIWILFRYIKHRWLHTFPEHSPNLSYCRQTLPDILAAHCGNQYNRNAPTHHTQELVMHPRSVDFRHWVFS